MNVMSEIFCGKGVIGTKGILQRKGALRTAFIPDEDAAEYFNRITVAGSSISDANKFAVNELIIGLKSDGLWSSIKAACILAGANDLAGALVPLAGTAPISIGFVPEDHDISTGLQGDGVGKYLDSQRPNSADPKNNNHVAVYITHGGTHAICGANMSGRHIYDGFPTTGEMWITNNSYDQSTPDDTGANTVGFVGLSRPNGDHYQFRRNGTTHLIVQPSTTHAENNLEIFSRGGQPYTGRIAFYSLGRSLDLAALDSRISNYLRSIDV